MLLVTLMNTIQFLIKNIDFEKPIDIENDI